MRKIEDLKKEILEEGRSHPLVEALLSTLQVRLQVLHDNMEGAAASGNPETHLYVLGGRANEVRNVIALITKTEGRDE